MPRIRGASRERIVALYNAVNNTHYTNVEDLSIKNLRDALYLGGGAIAGKKLYGRSLVKLPTPKYYVFYNGLEKDFEQMDLHLSDAYTGDGDVEVTAHMINVNAGRNEAMMKNCKPLSDYAELFRRQRINYAETDDKELATDMTMDSCIRDGILADILLEERARMREHLIGGLTEEEKEELHAWEKECEREEGRKEGHEEAGFEAVDKLVSEGSFDMEKACDILEVDLSGYRKWKAAKEKQGGGHQDGAV